MPGSGKSTVGRLLAEKLTLDFYDLDAEIESTQGRKIAKIFSEDGEESFRNIEAATLLNLTSIDGPIIIAVGGGTPCFYNGMRLMNEAGITVYLDTPLATLISRTQRKQHRPLLGGNHDVQMKLLLEKRQQCYSQAKYAIETAGVGLSEKVDKIIGLLEGEIRN